MLFVAEVGINHSGDINIAKELIDMVCNARSKAGVFDSDVVVKFQKRDVESCVPKHMWNKIKYDTPWGDISYIDYKRKIEFGKEEFDEIDNYCKEKNIRWSTSVWDIKSLEFIMGYDVPFIKIPSAMVTNIPLLKAVKKIGKPIFMSLGMSSFEEINKAVKVLEGSDLTILWCNSSYPASDYELDLRMIPELKYMFPDCIIGYSGHEVGISPAILARVLGAEVIEKHVTLDRCMWGTDQAASLPYDQLYRLIRDISKVPVWLGKKEVVVYPSEEKVRDKLRWM